MRSQKIVVTRQDLDRLNALLEDYRGIEEHDYLQKLKEELTRAQVVEPSEVTSDVVTMNSTFKVRVKGTKRSQTWTVVYPSEADVTESRISVLAPLGTAFLGCRVGDEFEWDVPAGRRTYHIEKITYQPESAGDFAR